MARVLSCCVVLTVLLTVPHPAFTQLLPTIGGPPATLERTAVPAAGRHQVLIEVARFGRYAITVESEQGTSLQLIDRVAGPGEIAGFAGEDDGRLDLFLDRGEYKLIVSGHPEASGEATIGIHPFAELNPSPAPQLIELKPVATSLGDRQQRSYWLEIHKRRWVAIEAAGRALVDLRLWLEGSWLYDAVPTTEVLDPVIGQPLNACRLAVQLEPGLYLLTAYGGVPQPWAEDSEAFPFHLHMGIPALATAGRARHEVGPLGIDRWLVPSQANFYRIELPEQQPAELGTGIWSETAPFSQPSARSEITKESREPAAEIHSSSTSHGFDIVTVRAPAGQPYILQHFERRWQYHFSGTGTYWVSTIHSGHPEDSIDATGIVAHWDASGRLQRQPLAEQTIAVDQETPWASRCNLLDELSLFIDVRATGAYTIESKGVRARFRIEPFFVYRPANYEQPDARPAGSTWELDAGYYVLTVEPVKRGILDLVLRPAEASGFFDALLELFSDDDQPVDAAPVVASLRFPELYLQRHHGYTLFLNRQPGVEAGIILRSLPMDLDDGLPLTLRPGEEVEIDFRASEPSRLEAVTEDGSILELAVDGSARRRVHEVGKGRHQLRLSNSGEGTVVCSAATTPLRLLSTTELPPLPEAALDRMPDFEVLSPSTPLHFDLEWEERRTFLVNATADALYRLETTGLLDTHGQLRSRLVTDLAQSSSGGSGRNFFIQQALHQGDYQLTVATRGRSAGHLGLELTPNQASDGGELGLDLPARTALSGGESVLYRFDIAEAGTYRLRAWALGRIVRCRLEDGDGWPIARPGIAADISRHFEPGSYRLLLLPEPLPGRRLTLLERHGEPARFDGHGPHRLPLATPVRHRWLEPEAGGERTPDSWLIELAGSSEVQINLDGEMQGRLLRLEDDRADEVALVPPERGFDGRLEAGLYRLDAVCSRTNNRVDYQVEVRPRSLMAGLERHLLAPATVEVAVGDDSLIEISSFGSQDVRARLEDVATGATVAASDDRSGDWNFHLSARLEPGEYNLAVEPVGSHRAQTLVRMDARPSRVHTPLVLPLSQDFEPGDAVHLLPLAVEEGQLLLVSAASTESIGVAVERADGDGWHTVASRTGTSVRLELPAQAELEHRLRLWSVDRRGVPVHLQVLAVTPPEIGEGRLARGGRLEIVAGIEPPLAVAAVDPARAGALRLLGAPGPVRWSARSGQALAPAHLGVLPLAGERGWLAVDLEQPRAKLRAERIVLGSDQGDGVQLGLETGTPVMVDLAPPHPRLVLTRAEAMLGQPAVVIGQASSLDATTGRAMIVIRQQAAALCTGGDCDSALAWLAEPTLEPVDVRLSVDSFETTRPEPAAYGQLKGEIEPGTARAFDLPVGATEVHLGLAAGITAATIRGGTVESVHFGGGAPLVERFQTSAETLILASTAPEARHFAIDLMPLSAQPFAVAPNAPWEGILAGAGTLRLDVRACAGDDCRLHVLGTAAPATFVSEGGRVERGHALDTRGAAGTLLVEHSSGVLLAFFGPRAAAATGLWSAVDLPAPSAVTLPAQVELSGSAANLRLDAADKLLLSITSDGPAVFGLDHTQGSEAWVGLGPGTFHRLLGDGSAELRMRALGGRQLSHRLELGATAVTAVTEGLGPEVLLAPGSGRAFAFTVVVAGPVGVGARANPDSLDCRLLSAGGEVVGEGIVQMHELEPGEYLLLLRAPADGDPVLARAAVVGIERPPTGPPEDVIRRYLEMEGVQP